jgi:hypothetical protein
MKIVFEYSSDTLREANDHFPIPLESLSLPKMLSGGNALKISDQQLNRAKPGNRM